MSYPVMSGIIFLVASIGLLWSAYLYLQTGRCFVRGRPFRGASFLLVALFFFFFCAYSALFAGEIYHYRKMSQERPVADVSIVALGRQQFELSLNYPDGLSEQFLIHGDLWQLDARMVTFKSIFYFFGWEPAFRFERLSGRYRSVHDERYKIRSVYSLVDNESEENTNRDGNHERSKWSLANSTLFSAFVDSRYGAGVYVPLAHQAVYSVYLTPAGLKVRAVNTEAEVALDNWSS
ncbi:MAG: hypothetical protein MI864_07830 [Pseudomonadales bacterium]|nr:hypothetical protein [Pseudomonadales bacterium]